MCCTGCFCARPPCFSAPWPTGLPTVSPLNTAGVPGYAAREAFVKQLAQHQEVATVVAANAARELGLDASRITSNLMLEFVNRKIALGDHKQLSYFATLLAHAWQAGRYANMVLGLSLSVLATKGTPVLQSLVFQGR